MCGDTEPKLVGAKVSPATWRSHWLFGCALCCWRQDWRLRRVLLLLLRSPHRDGVKPGSMHTVMPDIHACVQFVKL